MEKKLLELIISEDKRNTLSDGMISKKLSISRREVIRLRKKLNIEDYSTRRQPYLLQEISNILKKNANISSVALTTKVNEHGFDVSRYLVSGIRKEMFKNAISNEDEQSLEIHKIENKEDEEFYKSIIGFDGSIEFQINQAKAAVLYPPHGLNTLIIGQTGTGKSFLAEIMHKIAVRTGKLDSTTNLIKLNCADYSNNPQLLLSQLFGYEKGAFTGAEIAKDGLIKKADNGILFLDEIHRLPIEGQEILFSVIDNGKYRKLGQTENEESVNVMLIAATTEDINSHLLGTFRRRIPMLIELPSLAERTTKERYKIIIISIKEEAHRIGIEIHLKSEALCCLLLYHCVGNIGQLKSDIQVACARAYLRFLNEAHQFLNLESSDFNIYVQQGLLRKKYSNEEVNQYLYQGLVISCEEDKIKLLDEKGQYLPPNQIYSYIEKRSEDLKKQGFHSDLIFDIINRELDIKLEGMIKKVNWSLVEETQEKNITKIVGSRIVEIVKKMIELAEKNLGAMNKSLFYCLALHFSETIFRIQENKKIINLNPEIIRKTHFFEYETASEMIQLAEKYFNLDFPDEEIGLITLYLKNHQNFDAKFKQEVKIIIATHGNVALEMAKIVNQIIGQEVVYSICLPLDDKPEEALNRTRLLVKKINKTGILFLVDMGSLVTFGEIITKETGIPTKTVTRVDVAMALEVAIKAKNNEMSLNELYAVTKKQNTYLGCLSELEPAKKKVIVTLCITGEGAALSIKKIIEDMLPENVQNLIEVIPIGLMGEQSNAHIRKINEDNEVIAIVGTINPMIEEIQFFPIEQIIEAKGMNKLKKLLEYSPEKSNAVNDITEIISSKCIFPQISFQDKNEAINYLVDALETNGYVKKSYRESIHKREKLKSTIFFNGIVIPHTYPKHVIKPTIAIATLQRPITWGENYETDVIFMLALGYTDHRVLSQLYALAKNQESLQYLRASNNLNEMLDFFKNFSDSLKK